MKWYEDPVYTRMCKKAKRIQEGWKPVVGDWFYKEDGIGHGLWLVSDIQEYGKKPHLDMVLYCSGERMHSPPFGLGLVEFRNPGAYTWLPTQEDLQEMCWELTGTKWSPFFALTMVRDFAQENPYLTMSQLWLAFVQKELHNEVWTGKEWVKVKILGG